MHARAHTTKLALAAGVLALMAMLGRTGHMLLVPHIMCAVHGIEHAEQRDSAQSNHEAQHSDDAVAKSAERSHVHDQCLATDNSTTLTAPLPAPPSTLLLALLPQRLSSQLFYRRRGQLLGLAPKTSPPTC